MRATTHGVGMKVLNVIFWLLATSLALGAQTSNTSKLTGTIYDPNGAVVVGAKITAVGSGKTFSAVSGNDGVYLLVLPFSPYDLSRGYKMSRYDITVESPGFKRSETKGYAFMPSQFGKMYLDIALDVGYVSDLDILQDPTPIK